MTNLGRFSMIASEITDKVGGCPTCGCSQIIGKWEDRGMLFSYCASCNIYRPAERNNGNYNTKKETRI